MLRVFFAFLCFLLPALAQAQTTLRTLPPPTPAAPPGGPLTLTTALQTGLGQSLLLQTGALEVERQRALGRTAYDLPRTVLDYQVGQISGPLRDYSFNLVQQVAFPAVYGAQRRLLNGQVLAAEQRVRVQRRELALRISLTYYELLLNYQQAAVLRRQDSLYRRAARAARIRYQVGETNRLEQVSAEARLRELQQRLRLTLTDVQVQRQQLGVLLNLGQPATIDTAAAPLAPAPDSVALAADNNPTLALLIQEVAVSRQLTRVEELRRLPDLRAGYFYQTINQERGFQVAQAGIALPLVGGAQKNRIRAARLGEQAAEAQLNYVQAQLSGQLLTLRQQLSRARASVAYYRQTALPQAQLVLSTAEKSFRAGDIDYVEYVVNTEPAWQIQQAYLTQLRQYNELALTLSSLTSPDSP
ncbi:TolC family protein [Hymenobacter weizhouensis]|uniref:TolC family protein n=1 Tax=Hymenobacter sp. YIM 151500-1 TaxID=2987689 RepID=UPI002226AC0A|nr:TolC family protein [Hymenobacter sp. YIM 151500-1]UYZ65103.1 TolC family protein [Hymenobacter sp. YIM 151500-1]